MLKIQTQTLSVSTPAWGKILMATAIVLALTVGIFANTFAATSTTVVTETKKEGWVFNADTSTASPYEFNEDAWSVGDGSLYVLPIQNDSNGGTHQGRLDKFIATLPVNYTSDELDSVSFDFQLGEGVDVGQADQVYLNVYTNLPGSETYFDCRFDQVATIGSTTDFNTVTFESDVAPTDVVGRGGATCPATLSELPEGSTVKALTLNVGDTSLSDQNASAYFDNVVINAAGNTAQYDFEEFVPTAETKDDCKNGGFAAFGFKNQGACVSSVAANENASFKRN